MVILQCKSKAYLIAKVDRVTNHNPDLFELKLCAFEKNVRRVVMCPLAARIQYNRQLVGWFVWPSHFPFRHRAETLMALIIQCWMWTTLSILLPVINDFPCVNDIAEPVLIQAFIAKSSVKARAIRSASACPLIKRNSTPCSKADSIQCTASDWPWSVDRRRIAWTVQCCPEYANLNAWIPRQQWPSGIPLWIIDAGKHLILRPVESVMTKSIDQVRLAAPDAAAAGVRC